jgi:transposase
MPSTWRNRLSEDQIDALDTLRMKAPSAAVFRNCTMILMSDAGRSKASIAEDLGCGTATVERVRRLYKTMGILGLTPIKPPGRPSRLSEALREPVLEAVQTDPRTLGYGFSTWSVARLTEHLRRRCRLRASPSTVRRVLSHEQFSLQRPKHTLEGKRDEKAHAKAKKELAGLKKKHSARTQPKRLSSKTKPKSTRTRC